MEYRWRETSRTLATWLLLPVLATACAPAHDLRLDGTHAGTVPRGTVLEVELVDPISSETSAVEDRFSARVLVPILIGDRVVIEEGSEVTGRVLLVVPSVNRDGRMATIGLAITGLKNRNAVEVPLRARFCVLSLGLPIDAEVDPFVLTATGRGRDVTIPRGAKLEVRLRAPVTLRVGA